MTNQTPPVADWQTIETAPKDGSLMDLWKVSWKVSGDCRYTDCHWSKTANGWFRGADYVGVLFTHWMPIPPPPGAAAPSPHEEQMSDLDKLIERLEKLEGPDRALDEAIVLEVPIMKGFLQANKDGGFEVLHYTASLDAALSLVPEEWTAWEIRSSRRKTRFSVDLSRLTECDAGDDWAHGRGPTPAIAMCGAVLRALRARTP